MRKKSIKRLYIITIIYGLAANFVHPVTPTLLNQLNFDKFMFGVSFAMMSLTYFIFSPFWGKIMEKVSINKILALCLPGYALGQFIFCYATNAPILIFARLFAGCFSGGVMVSQMMYLSRNSEVTEKGKNLAINATFAAISSTLGYFFGGVFGNVSITFTFMVQVVCLVLLGGYSFFYLGDEPGNNTDSFTELIKQSNPIAVFREKEVFANKYITTILIISFFASLASTSYDQSLNYVITDQFDLPPSYNGIVKAITGVLSLIANSLISIKIVKKHNSDKYLATLYFLCSMSIALLLIVTNLYVFLGLGIIFLVLNNICQPIMQNLVTKSPENQGSVIGLFNALRGLGMVLGAIVAGFTYILHDKMPFAVSLFFFTVSAIMLLRNKYIENTK
jgi:Arabinose efflux permease